MGIIDIASIPNLIEDYGFTLIGNFSDKIMSIGIISLIGKVFLILSLFTKPKLNKRVYEIVGIALLWVSVYFLTSGNWSFDSSYEIAFWTSIPFLISSLILIFLILTKTERTELNEK